jgi:hypothetical protein
MKKTAILVGIVLALGIGASVANASETLTFEGLGDNEAIGSYYAGGLGGNGSGPGPNYGITFGSDSLALVSDLAGGTGNFSNAPSGNTVAFFQTGLGDVMDVAGGFNTGFSFYYADQLGFTGSVDVFSGLDGSGSELASLSLSSTPNPYTDFIPVGVAFLGTAESVVFSGSADFIAFDNITLGATSPMSAVPEPSTWLLMIAGIGGIGLMLRRSKQSMGFRSKDAFSG